MPQSRRTEDAGADRRADTLAELAALLSEGRDAATLATRAIEATVRATGAAGAFVYLWDPDEELLVLRIATEGWPLEAVGRVTLRMGEGVAGWAALMRETVVLPSDPKKDPRWKFPPDMQEPELGSMVAVPIVAPGDEVLGVFFLYSFTEDAFPPAHARLATEVGSLLASGLTQAETLAELKMQSAAAMFLADLPDDAWGSLEQGLQIMADRCAAQFQAEICAIEVVSDRLLPERRTTGIGVLQEFREQQDLSAQREPLNRQSLSDLVERANLHRLRVPLEAGGPIGVLTWYRERRFSREDEVLAEAVAAQIAVGALALTASERDRPTLEQLLFSSDVATTERLLRRHRWEPRPTWVTVLRVIPPAGTELDGSAAGRTRAALLDVFGDDQRSLLLPGRGGLHLAMARNVDPTYRDLLADRLRALGRERGMRITVGVGPTVSAAETQQGLARALAAFRWAELVDTGEGAVVRYEDIAHLRLLPAVDLSVSAELKPYLSAFAALVKYDLDSNAELAQTLEAFIACRGSMARTSASLFIHRNTLRQRMQRIEELVGSSPEELEDWITAGIAARLLVRSESDTRRR